MQIRWYDWIIYMHYIRIVPLASPCFVLFYKTQTVKYANFYLVRHNILPKNIFYNFYRHDFSIHRNIQTIPVKIYSIRNSRAVTQKTDNMTTIPAFSNRSAASVSVNRTRLSKLMLG